jgi:thiol:disulfide interchange protein DsbD
MPSLLSRWLSLPALLLMLAAPSQPAFGLGEELIPAAEAFRYSVAEDRGELVVRWTVEPGYYLYREKMSYASLTDGVTLEAPLYPRGATHEDEFFGEQEIYDTDFEVRVPYRSTGAERMTLELRSQGCADIGVCFPPQRWQAEVVLASAGAAPAAAAPPAGGLGLPFATPRPDDFLPEDEAFAPLITILDPVTLEIGWRIAAGYYLYKPQFSARFDSDDVRAGPLTLPAGQPKEDEYYGETEVYYDAVFATVPLQRRSPDATTATLILEYQGCAEDGICYPLTVREFEVSLPLATAAEIASAPPPDAAGPVSDQDRYAGLIRDSSIAALVGAFFVAGLLLSLTPCVLPMIPILSGIIAGEGDDVTPMRGFSLSLLYVLGMALTYTIAGAAFAAVGQQAQAVFQKPWILITFAGLFVVLALGMFGLFNIQMPSSIQSRLATISGNQKSGTAVGAFIMGALSSLVVTACVAPPLVAALAVIGQSGDVVRGALALFALSIGMGAPLLVVGASAGKLMLKAGPWMETVKNAFGFVMLGLAIWMLSRLLPGGITLLLWAVLIFIAGVFLGALTPLTADATGPRKLAKGFGMLAVLYGAILFIGSLTGGDDPLQPLQGSMLTAVGTGGAKAHDELTFERVKTVAELEARLADARSRRQPVMLDFYADWCVSCKEMEKYTFTDATVQSVLSGTLLLQADVTANDDADQALLKRFGIFGPPSIIFFGPDGAERPAYQVVGYMKAERFAPHARQAIAGEAIAASR